MQQVCKTELRNNSIISAARVERLRHPKFESELARYLKELETTANLVRDCITYAITDHHDDGGLIQTARFEVLDIERMETRGESFVYDCEGNQIFLDSQKRCPLIPLEEAFKASSRRTLARLFDKANRPSKQSVDIRLWSLMFWLDVGRIILEKK
ncbi:MAG: hypothetical protein ABJO52_20925 [Nisaea sp.]|uniref:hypothetical protein n=1 Tax=Nisaea sp. TaxID=2024842 RepID=UPI0032983CFC